MIKIYEVMSIENGLPLFFIEHIERLKLSISSINDYSIDELIKIAVKNIKPFLTTEPGYNVKLTYSEGIFSANRLFAIKPDKERYIFGDKVGIYDAERHNPLIKQENLTFRQQTEIYSTRHDLYDVLLKNKLGHITEGSKSNFLLIDKKNRVITSTIGESLNGITRDKIFNICKKLNITIIEQNITKKTLSEVKCLFITGTSPEILPIKSCDNINFTIKNKTLDILRSEYLKLKDSNKITTKGYFNLD
ncbi:MAG: aminotransferase class IV [Spirochaetaceae bacterium]